MRLKRSTPDVTWNEILALIFIVFAFAYAGHNDYEDELLYAAHYCDMVKAGRWPNYNKINCYEKGNEK